MTREQLHRPKETDPVANRSAGPTTETTAVRRQPQPMLADPASGVVVQTELAVGSADDPFERQADLMADTVMRNLTRHSPGSDGVDDEVRLRAADGLPGGIRRICRSVSAPAETQTIGAEGGRLDDASASAIERSRGKGAPLEAGVRGMMESQFGTGFSGVRVHADAGADTLARSMQATAFTTGSDIFFRSGAYAPSNSGGQRLLAHELTHVVQQGGSGGLRRSIIRREGEPDDRAKRLELVDREANDKMLAHAKEDFLFDKSLQASDEDMAQADARLGQQAVEVQSVNDVKNLSPYFLHLYGLNPERAFAEFRYNPIQQATIHARMKKPERITKPADLFPAAVIAAHLGKFANGAHAFIDPSSTDKIEGAVDSYFRGWGLDSNFVAPLDEANALNAKAHKERGIETIEDELGIPGKYWSKSAWNPTKYLVRWVIPAPKTVLDANETGILLEMASGTESRADPALWVAGGLTKGGASEAVIKAIPREELIKMLAKGTIKQKKEFYPETRDNIV